MSNLIVMPDVNGAFPGEEKVVTNYGGRCLALNITKLKVFQTHKFYLGPNRQFATVPPDADMVKICTAVLQGNLIDVTDQKGQGVDLEDGNKLSPISEIADPNLRKVFIGVGRTNEITPAGTPRPLFIAVPSDEAEEKAMIAELELTGRIDGTYSSTQEPGVRFGGIEVSDIEPRKYIANTKRETSYSLLVKSLKLVASDVMDYLLRRK